MKKRIMVLLGLLLSVLLAGAPSYASGWKIALTPDMLSDSEVSVAWANDETQLWVVDAAPSLHVGDTIDIVAVYHNVDAIPHSVLAVALSTPYALECVDIDMIKFVYTQPEQPDNVRYTVVQQDMVEYAENLNIAFCDGLIVEPGETIGFVWQYRAANTTGDPPENDVARNFLLASVCLESLVVPGTHSTETPVEILPAVKHGLNPWVAGGLILLASIACFVAAALLAHRDGKTKRN